MRWDRGGPIIGRQRNFTCTSVRGLAADRGRSPTSGLRVRAFGSCSNGLQRLAGRRLGGDGRASASQLSSPRFPQLFRLRSLLLSLLTEPILKPCPERHLLPALPQERVPERGLRCWALPSSPEQTNLNFCQNLYNHSPLFL